ncbi:hypothetical protein FRB94_005696 [Tulasnella sp. JGI-2019a]|nr:hypothetical protein FRB94_005696 [Tulasnella sp. JGI-2019a]
MRIAVPFQVTGASTDNMVRREQIKTKWINDADNDAATNRRQRKPYERSSGVAGAAREKPKQFDAAPVSEENPQEEVHTPVIQKSQDWVTPYRIRDQMLARYLHPLKQDPLGK